MNKKLLATLLVGVSVLGGSNVALASEVQVDGGQVVVQSQSVNELTEELNREFGYAMQETTIAVDTVRAGALTKETRDYAESFMRSAHLRLSNGQNVYVNNEATANNFYHMAQLLDEVIVAIQNFDANTAKDATVVNELTEELNREFGYAMQETTLAIDTVRAGALTKETRDYVDALVKTAHTRLLNGQDVYVNNEATANNFYHMSELLDEVKVAIQNFDIAENLKQEFQYAMEETTLAIDTVRAGALTKETRDYAEALMKSAHTRLLNGQDVYLADENTAADFHHMAELLDEVILAIQNFDANN